MRVGRPIAGAIASHEGEADPHPVYETDTGVGSKIATHKADAYAHHTPPSLYIEGARVYHSINQSIDNMLWQQLAFDSQRYDSDQIHDPVTNNSRLTCKTAGRYLIIGQIRFAVNTTGRRMGRILLNGITTIGYTHQTPVSEEDTNLIVSTIYDLGRGDYVELGAWQNSGASLDVIGGNDAHQTHFSMELIA